MNKKSFLLVLIFALSTETIFKIDWFLNFFQINDYSIKNAEKLSALLLIWTGTILFWYTLETYKLRVLAEKNNYGQLVIDRENTDINFAGLVIALPESKTKFMNIDLYIKNIGKGSLKITDINISGQSYVSGKNPDIKVGLPLFRNKFLTVQDTIRMDFFLEIEKWYMKTIGFWITIQYEDIVGIHHQRIEFSNIDLTSRRFELKDLGKNIINGKM